MPSNLRNFISVTRLNKPVGFLLLFWPCSWGLSLGLYFEKDLNTKYGSGFSIQPKFTQSAYFRFHNKSEMYDGLYFVGAGTHPGAGVPGVLSSAKVLDKIL